tara:strand:+ start:318 stop:1277 length:960 start_codon:yes stop_codon:yes gene_type:complete
MKSKSTKILLEIYKEFLNYFWLRPESAIVQSFRAIELRKTVYQRISKKNKFLDVSCGDGVFTFIALGGKLGTSFDSYKSIKNKQRSAKFDAYDHIDKNFKIKILKKPSYKIDTGTDWKLNLLKKSKHLKLFKKLVLHNNEKRFPLNDNHFDFVYSNSAYWVKNIKQHLIDMKRVAKKNGYLYLHVKFKDTYLATLIKNQTKISFGPKFEKIIDGGRYETWKGLKTKKEFDKILDGISGLKVISYKPLYGDIIMLIWDIGFRPLFKPLFEMSKSLNKTKYIKVKTEWIKILYDMSENFISNYKPKKKGAMEYTILLKKVY